MNAIKDKFLASIGRSLQHSLAEISTPSQALQACAADGRPAPSDLNRRLEGINKSAESVLSLLQNILEWPRVQTGQKLDLLDMEIADRDLGYLVEALDNLRFLSLAGTKITDSGLAHVKALKGLQELHLNGTKITSQGLDHLKGLEHLEILDLKDTRTTDDGLSLLKPLHKLNGLDLTRTLVTDAGLAHVGSFAELRTLILWDTHVTADGLRHLRGLRNLQELMLWHTPVTDQGADELRAALPGCDISTDMFT